METQYVPPSAGGDVLAQYAVRVREVMPYMSDTPGSLFQGLLSISALAGSVLIRTLTLPWVQAPLDWRVVAVQYIAEIRAMCDSLAAAIADGRVPMPSQSLGELLVAEGVSAAQETRAEAEGTEGDVEPFQEEEPIQDAPEDEDDVGEAEDVELEENAGYIGYTEVIDAVDTEEEEAVVDKKPNMGGAKRKHKGRR